MLTQQHGVCHVLKLLLGLVKNFLYSVPCGIACPCRVLPKRQAACTPCCSTVSKHRSLAAVTGVGPMFSECQRSCGSEPICIKPSLGWLPRPFGQ
jgi:hypothetical protein